VKTSKQARCLGSFLADYDSIPILTCGENTDDEESLADEYDVGEDDESASEEIVSVNATITSATIRSGQISRPCEMSIETMGELADLQGTAVELRYLGNLAELYGSEVMRVETMTENFALLLVGTGLGGGLANTSELTVMNYKEAMKSKYTEACNEEVVNEKELFYKFNMFTLMPRPQVPKGANILTTIWAMKKKMKGKFH